VASISLSSSRAECLDLWSIQLYCSIATMTTKTSEMKAYYDLFVHGVRIRDYHNVGGDSSLDHHIFVENFQSFDVNETTARMTLCKTQVL
jgi:putative heme iron utilization protein